MGRDGTMKECPLCLKILDEDERRALPCPCGYQVCLFCYYTMRNLDDKCPACRQSYSGEFILAPSDALESSSSSSYGDGYDGSSFNDGCSTPGGRSRRLHSACLGSSVARSRSSSPSISQDSGSTSGRRGEYGSSRQVGVTKTNADLKDVRVIRRDLCYVVGLPLEAVLEEDKLKSFVYFGKYGKVVNVIVNKNPNFKAPDKKKSCAVYVTFAKEDSARLAILDLDDAVFENRRLKASYGTTKYCSNFLRGARCSNRTCFYLHERGRDEDSFTVQQLKQVKEHTRGLTCSTLLANELQNLSAEWKDSRHMTTFGKTREEVIEYFSNTPHRPPLPSIKAEVEAIRSAVSRRASSNVVRPTPPPPPPKEEALRVSAAAILPPPLVTAADPAPSPLSRSKVSLVVMTLPPGSPLVAGDEFPALPDQSQFPSPARASPKIVPELVALPSSVLAAAVAEAKAKVDSTARVAAPPGLDTACSTTWASTVETAASEDATTGGGEFGFDEYWSIEPCRELIPSQVSSQLKKFKITPADQHAYVCDPEFRKRADELYLHFKSLEEQAEVQRRADDLLERMQLQAKYPAYDQPLIDSLLPPGLGPWDYPSPSPGTPVAATTSPGYGSYEDLYYR